MAFIALNVALRLWLPEFTAVRVPWLVPAVEALLLVALLLSDPGNVVKHRRRLRRVVLALVVVLVLATLWATAVLIYDLVEGSGVTESPRQLLATGATVWLGNVLAFSFLYWLVDSGGPLARTELAFTNATAFSPTDVMPLTHRAKYTMVVQSTVALALFGLIVARAVNAFA